MKKYNELLNELFNWLCINKHFNINELNEFIKTYNEDEQKTIMRIVVDCSEKGSIVKNKDDTFSLETYA